MIIYICTFNGLIRSYLFYSLSLIVLIIFSGIIFTFITRIHSAL